MTKEIIGISVGMKEEGKMVKEKKNEKWKELNMCIKGIEMVDFEGRRQIINELSHVVLPLKEWKMVLAEERGIIAEYEEKRKGLYNWRGKLVLNHEWKEMIFIDGDFVKALSQEGKYSLFNLKGEKVLPGEYEAIDVIADLFGNKYLKLQAAKRKNGLYTMDLKPIIPCENNNYICYHDIALGLGYFKVYEDEGMKFVYLQNA